MTGDEPQADEAAPESTRIIAPRTTNKMARLAVWCVIFFPPLGVVLAHIALHQLNGVRGLGRTQATVAIVYGYSLIIGLLIPVVAILVFAVSYKAFL